MSKRPFLQIHTLTSWSSALLNRDDAGFAKRMPFGGAVRTRVSSQCLKRHWRTFSGEHDLTTVPGANTTVRSRISFQRFVVEPLVADGLPAPVVQAATAALVEKALGAKDKGDKADATEKGKKAKGEKGGGSDGPAVETKQVTVLGRVELDYLAGIVRDACIEAGDDARKAADAVASRIGKDKELAKNLKGMKLGAGLGAAMFGRMVTGDILSRVDAAIHVAHALTVHEQQSESDYFSAIDDLRRDDGEQSSGHINASELTSGLFYGYVVVDVACLEANLGGDREMAAEVLHRLVPLIATVTPGAKLGSTAPYAYASLVLAEWGRAQPRSLANAFLQPVPMRGDLLSNAYRALDGHLAEMDSTYATGEERAHAGIGTTNFRFGARLSMAELASRTSDWIRG